MATATKKATAPYEVAHVVSTIAIHVGSSTSHVYFGGDLISDQLLIPHLRGQEQIKILSFDSRDAYGAWLDDHEADLARLTAAARAMGYELMQHGQVFAGPRGLQVHLEVRNGSRRKAER